jgi:hypothetical protein
MKIIKYFECIIIFTIFLIFRFIIKQLQYIGQSSEWFSSRNLHPWESHKAMELYNKEYKEKVEKMLKDAK